MSKPALKAVAHSNDLLAMGGERREISPSLQPFTFEANAPLFALPQPLPNRSIWQRAQQALRGSRQQPNHQVSSFVSLENSDYGFAQGAESWDCGPCEHGVSYSDCGFQNYSHFPSQKLPQNNMVLAVPFDMDDRTPKSIRREDNLPHIELRQAWGTDIVKVLFPTEEEFSSSLFAEEMFEVELGDEEGTEIVYGDSSGQLFADYDRGS